MHKELKETQCKIYLRFSLVGFLVLKNISKHIYLQNNENLYVKKNTTIKRELYTTKIYFNKTDSFIYPSLYNLLSTTLLEPWYKGLAPTELKVSGFHVSGSRSLESLIFLRSTAKPAMAPIRAALHIISYYSNLYQLQLRRKWRRCWWDQQDWLKEVVDFHMVVFLEEIHRCLQCKFHLHNGHPFGIKKVHNLIFTFVQTLVSSQVEFSSRLKNSQRPVEALQLHH